MPNSFFNDSLVVIVGPKVNIVRCIHPTDNLLASIATTGHLRNLLLTIELEWQKYASQYIIFN